MGTATLSRAQFFASHLVKCAKCRGQWLKEYKDIPEDKRNHALEELIGYNHRDSNTI